MLRVGTKVDWLKLNNGHGNVFDITNLSSYKAIALFFYPKDFTPVCTAQACTFRDHYGEIQRLGGVAFGISLDAGQKHDAFRRHYELPFELISDDEGHLGRCFGVRRLGGLLWHKRVTFVLDSSLQITDVIHDEKNAALHAERFIEILKSRP